jgi:hypothetical protein
MEDEVRPIGETVRRRDVERLPRQRFGRGKRFGERGA